MELVLGCIAAGPLSQPLWIPISTKYVGNSKIQHDSCYWITMDCKLEPFCFLKQTWGGSAVSSIQLLQVQACENNDDGGSEPKLLGQKKNVAGGLQACEALCNQPLSMMALTNTITFGSFWFLDIFGIFCLQIMALPCVDDWLVWWTCLGTLAVRQ